MADPNKNIQMIGSQAEQSEKPVSQVRDSFRGGSVQMIGSEAEISHKTTPMGVFNKGISGGSVQMVGSECDLDRTPRRGWQSHDTPIAETSESVQSATAGYPHPGKKK